MSENQRQFVLKLPMRVQTSSKKKTALNLNTYRNLHFRSLSALKNKFHKIAEELLKDIPPLGRISLYYEVCPETKRSMDVGNVCSIVDKFFSDSLTKCGIIEDDNYNVVRPVIHDFGYLSEKEHVLVTITEIEPRKGNVMRILLDEDEIQKALESFVETLGLSGVTGVELGTDDDDNITAEVLMGEVKTESKPRTRKSKGGRPAGSKNKPKEDTKDVAVPAEDGDADDSTGSDKPSENTDKEDEADSKTASEPAKSKEGGKGKNLFGESQEESSKETTSDSPEEGGDTDKEVKPSKTRKSSIFDQ